MTRRLRSPHLVLIGLGSAIATITACSAPDAPSGSEDSTQKTAQAATVQIDVLNEGGASLGACAGTLVAPTLVVTAGHCVAGARGWTVTSPSGTAKFGDRYIDVVTEGDFLPPGTPIQVVEVEGTRIVVKRV